MPDVTPLVAIEDGSIVIRVTMDALTFATQHGPALERFDATSNSFVSVTVTDPGAWQQSVVRALRAESEDGTTLVHTMLDRALQHAFEQGEPGVEEN